MATIQWRPAVNALTVPASYRMVFVPRNIVGTPELAARIAAELPSYSAEELQAILAVRNRVVRQSLINGEQVTEEGSFTCSLAFTARLNTADDAPPPANQCLNVRVHALPPFVSQVRHAARLERLTQQQRQPLISRTEDTLLRLPDVLDPDGVLLLAGERLAFDIDQGDGECVIASTAGGRAVQHRFNLISNNAVMLMPELPAQPHPWNNEHTVSLAIRYAAFSAPRASVYDRMLRSPLTVSAPGSPGSPETGILTGSAATPYVSVIGGAVAADERLRIQVMQDTQGGPLLFSLLEIKEGGAAGAAVSVTENGEYSLPGFSGSAVGSLVLRVNNYSGLWEMIRNNYRGRLTDVLDVRAA